MQPMSKERGSGRRRDERNKQQPCSRSGRVKRDVADRRLNRCRQGSAVDDTVGADAVSATVLLTPKELSSRQTIVLLVSSPATQRYRR